jgi:hypothetical protein
MADPVSPDVRSRVTNIYHRYLDAVYEVEYYRAVFDETIRYSKFFDFIMALGAAFSGGSGVVAAINKSETGAWVCGILATATVVLTAAKAAYNWPEQITQASTAIEFYSRLATGYYNLSEDVRYQRELTSEHAEMMKKLGEQASGAPKITLRSLPDVRRRAIQDSIKARIPFKEWWRPGNENTPTASVGKA